MKSKFSYLMLGLLGFAACHKTDPLVMYGTPHADVNVSGKVTDAFGKPITGIKVSMGYGDRLDTLTSADGSYALSSKFGHQEALLIFTDIDGSDNGGEFVADTVDVKFTEDDRTGEGKGWYEGSFARTDVDVQLQSAEQ